MGFVVGRPTCPANADRFALGLFADSFPRSAALAGSCRFAELAFAALPDDDGIRRLDWVPESSNRAVLPCGAGCSTFPPRPPCPDAARSDFFLSLVDSLDRVLALDTAALESDLELPCDPPPLEDDLAGFAARLGFAFATLKSGRLGTGIDVTYCKSRRSDKSNRASIGALSESVK